MQETFCEEFGPICLVRKHYHLNYGKKWQEYRQDFIYVV